MSCAEKFVPCIFVLASCTWLEAKLVTALLKKTDTLHALQ